MKLSGNLLKHVVKLTNARGQVVHLLGTAHVSERSCLEVRELVHTIKPAAVFVELCEQRKGILEHGGKDDVDLTNKEIWDKVRSNEMNPFQVMYLSVMKMYDLRPGKEFVAASDAAKELGIPLVLGDRPVGITLSRLWMGLNVWQKAKLLWYFLPKPTFDDSAITSFQEKDVNQLLDNRDIITEETHRLGKLLPWVVECLINERDLFMVLELEMVRILQDYTQCKYSLLCQTNLILVFTLPTSCLPCRCSRS